MDHVVKLLAICERTADGRGVSVRVHPAMVSRAHPLAGVREAYNAVFVESESAGQLMFYGRGAGGAPTASAVLGDLVAVGRNRLSGGRGPRESAYADLQVRPLGAAETRYYISLDVADKAGVLAAVAQTFARHDVSIETLRQDGRGDDAALVIVTHRATESDLAASSRSCADSTSSARSPASFGSRGTEMTVTASRTHATAPGGASSRSTAIGCRSPPRPLS